MIYNDMLSARLTRLLKRFNYLIDKLINDFQRYDMDEASIVFLAGKTRNFMSFTHKIVLKVLFVFLNKFSSAKYKFNEEIIDIDKMFSIIFESMNNSLNEILDEKGDENKKENIEKIVSSLTLLKKLMADIADIVLSILKFQSDNIDENEFKNKYREFKLNIKDDENIFKKNYLE